MKQTTDVQDQKKEDQSQDQLSDLLRLLVVDGDALARHAVIRALLERHTDAIVRQAATLVEATSALTLQPLDCVFLSDELPDGNSLEWLKGMREAAMTVPVVFLTSHGSQKLARELIAAGVTDTLPKSEITLSSIDYCLRSALRFHQAQEQVIQSQIIQSQIILSKGQGREYQEELLLRDRAIAAAASIIIICDPNQPDCPIVYCNPAFSLMTGYPSEEIIGRNCRFLQGESTSRASLQQVRDCLREERECSVTLKNYRKDRTSFWNELRISPVRDTSGKLTHFIGVQSDITKRRTAEDALQQSEARSRAIVESLVEGIIFQDADGILQASNPSAEHILGLAFGQMAGRTSGDPRWRAIYEDGTDFPGERHPAMVALRTGQPQRDVVIGIHRPDDTRVWLSANSQPISHPETGEPLGVVTSFFDISAQRNSQQQVLARAEREALLNRVGQALRVSPDPEAVQQAAVSLLGEALGADRCYFAVYHLERGSVTVAGDWHREDLSSLKGIYPFPNTAEMFHELYQDVATPGQDSDQDAATSVITDAQTAPLSDQTRTNLADLGLRSRLSVALADGDAVMATLTVAMTEGPRAWTDEDVKLVNGVLVLLRTALALVRVTRREHNIAEQFQAVLQPETPTAIPGMELAAYYRAAWEDQGVGGDFSDVFAADKEVTFLVVGDVSGKGLSAASQVGTVRNMLRFGLLNGHTVAGSITALNRTLAHHELLTGFATLFVGRYDAQERKLIYVNCGQDAGLVLRAISGEVEALPPTGPVFGVFGGAEFAEQAVTLELGDTLVLYTDGLTEAGPTKVAMLTGDGVALLLREQAGQHSARQVVSGIIAGVDAHEGQGIRDDQCLLAGVVTG